MGERPIKRFERSMAIDYEKWHDGIGYDLDSLDELDDKGKLEAERLLVPRAAKDWRDLEALERLDTPSALAAIVGARRASDPTIRLVAHTYGPSPTPEEWDVAIVSALQEAEPFAGLVPALRAARDHPSPAVVEELWSKVRTRSPISYHAAETLCLISGILSDESDMTHRDLFLRIGAADSDDRKAAVRALESMVGPSRSG